MTIWYDLSDIYNWKGNFTGIQRVVYNLAKRFSTSDFNVKFFVLYGGKFNEVTFSDLQEKLATQEKEVLSANNSEISSKLTLRKLAAKVRHKVMVNTKELAKQSRFSKPLKNTYLSARSKFWSIKSVLKNKGIKQTGNSIPFNKNDLVMVCGGNWHLEGYAQDLRKAKKEKGFKLLHFVQDLTAIENPALTHPSAEKALTDYFSLILPLSDTVVTISESTKKDVQSFIRDTGLRAPRQISTIRLGDGTGDSATKVVPQKPKRGLPKDFILSVGTIEVRKNHRLIYYAYKLAAQKGIELAPVVLAGKKGWQIDETYALLSKDPSISQKIILLNGVSDAELDWLYKNCMFTVLPAFYEGWGLTIAESLHYSKPCISSNTSSMPEVADSSLVTYVSPYDTNEFLQAIYKLSSDKLYKTQSKYIETNYREFSWDETYNMLLKIAAID